MSIAETELLSQMMAGAALTQAICSVAELGVADQIEPGAPRSVEHLAEVTGAHERSLYRVLRYMASCGIFRETENRHFDHTPLSAALRSDAPNSFRAAGRMFYLMKDGWGGLHHSILTGKPGFDQAYGQPMFDFIGTHPELPAVFDAGMTSFHGHETPAMLDAYDFSGINTLADIGGGNGSLLTAALRRYPKMKGILFDLGHVVARTKERLLAAGVGDRCSIVEGSFFESVPKGADAYLLRHIIHDWTDEQSVQILNNVRNVIPPDGRVLLVEFAVPRGNERSLAKATDMLMLIYTGGLERTEDEYSSLFQQAGFRLSGVTPTASAVAVVEGRPV
ncbi:MAG TPA: methyltransferase [Candidatus Acidoferrum sp.]|nr:methyltransferase [Candidatus Acidoferrum sp.]